MDFTDEVESSKAELLIKAEEAGYTGDDTVIKEAEAALDQLVNHFTNCGDYAAADATVQSYCDSFLLGKQKAKSVQKEYKYYMNSRPLGIGAQPKGFSRFDEEDKGGRFGAIFYPAPLTPQQIEAYELTPAK